MRIRIRGLLLGMCAALALMWIIGCKKREQTNVRVIEEERPGEVVEQKPGEMIVE